MHNKKSVKPKKSSCSAKSCKCDGSNVAIEELAKMVTSIEKRFSELSDSVENIANLVISGAFKETEKVCNSTKSVAEKISPEKEDLKPVVNMCVKDIQKAISDEVDFLNFVRAAQGTDMFMHDFSEEDQKTIDSFLESKYKELREEVSCIRQPSNTAKIEEILLKSDDFIDPVFVTELTKNIARAVIILKYADRSTLKGHVAVLNINNILRRVCEEMSFQSRHALLNEMLRKILY